jgi:hypothetical protein
MRLSEIADDLNEAVKSLRKYDNDGEPIDIEWRKTSVN